MVEGLFSMHTALGVVPVPLKWVTSLQYQHSEEREVLGHPLPDSKLELNLGYTRLLLKRKQEKKQNPQTYELKMRIV